MDAVTHQPLGKHAAIKGTDGVFFWDLNRRPEITPGGVMQGKTEFVGNMRKNYLEWYATMKEQDRVLTENNPSMVSNPKLSLLHAKPKFLLGRTDPSNLQGWNRLLHHFSNSSIISSGMSATV